VGPFIHYRLQTVGYSGPEIFSPDAIQRIALYAQGIPRLINGICDNALLY
jgi:type II secretory pathway predicted ATPase ExeA